MNDFWEWINQTLVPGLFNGAWYNGNTGKPGFLNDKMSFVVGLARIRQLRVKSGMHSDSRLLNAQVIQRAMLCLPKYLQWLESNINILCAHRRVFMHTRSLKSMAKRELLRGPEPHGSSCSFLCVPLPNASGLDALLKL